ncbi:transposase [Flavobacterium oreochromis]|uniref:transposase n=1 Tax=Flavobacterium oreochromis TaxID=2906078 RepID=UPI00385ACDFD
MFVKINVTFKISFRSTNASAESFNAKIKAFRSKFRGVRNIEFFLFRLTNLYA